MAALDVLNKDVSLSFLKLEFLQCIRENTKTGVFRGASGLPINRASWLTFHINV